MDGTLQERDPFWLGLFAGHGATLQVLAVYCELKQSSDIVASPGTMLAPALSTDREQQQHILTPASAKAATAQRHAHHCSICGAVKHTHTYTHAHTLTRMRMRTHIHTHKHTGTHACAHTRVHAYTSAHTLTRTCICMHTRVVQFGLVSKVRVHKLSRFLTNPRNAVR